MELLQLDDSRWYELCHRNWADGKPSSWAPDAPFVPDALRLLDADPENIDLWNDLYPWLCSEGTAWAASYAVVPYALEFAGRVDVTTRYEYLYFMGLVVQCSCPESGQSFEIKPYLRDAFEESLRLAIPMLAEVLPLEHNQSETRHIISTIAALKGHPKLADVLENLNCIVAECSCGNTVYPADLQEIV